MGTASKILLIILIIVIIIVFYALVVLEIPRYFRIKTADIFALDRNYEHLKYASNERVVVSLSTIPERLQYMKPTLCSILSQTVRVDEIAINIPWLSRKGIKYEIPDWMTKLKNVKIYRVAMDEGPATKLLPTLRREKPNTRIIVIDDDNIYNSRLVNVLNRTFERYDKKAAITNHGLRVSCSGDLPGVWERFCYFTRPSTEVDLLQGFSGFLVTPKMFPEQAFDIYSGPKEAISVDDIWFSGWLRYNGIQIFIPDYTYKQVPIVNLGDMRLTPALARGENKAFVTDHFMIKWFITEQGVKPINCRQENY